MSETATDLRTLSTCANGEADELRRAWDRRLQSAPSLQLPARRTVVVVPHPDDESLSSGGLIMHQLARGVPVVVVAVTDGEAAYSTWPHPGLAAIRRDEQRTALKILGVPVSATVRLGLPDSALVTHGDELVDRLDAIIEPDDVVVAPWVHDWHPDHVACGRAAQHVAASHRCTLIGSLFWALHHIDPRDHPDAAFVTLALTDDERLWRREALRSHRSQFDPCDHLPILDQSLIDHLHSPIEQYVVSA